MSRVNTDQFYYTGRTITDMQKARYVRAMCAPMIRIPGGKFPDSPEKVLHQMALDAGLPDIKGYYGCDFRNGEFICLIDAVGTAPDEWRASS